MKSVGGKIVLWLLIIGMLVFTSIRTVDFLQMTFGPDQQYVAYLGLVAFDAGIIGWMVYASNSASGAAQRAIAYGMIFICMAGVLTTTIMDMTIVGASNGLTKLPMQWSTVGLWAVIIVICMNVIAGVLVHLCDPKHQQHMKEEELRDRIIAATHTHMAQTTAALAPQIAQRLAAHWGESITQQMIGSLPQSSQVSIAAPVVESTLAAAPQLQTTTTPPPADTTPAKKKEAS